MIKPLTPKLSRIAIIFLAFLVACNPSASQISTPTSDIKLLPTIKPTSTFAITATPAPNILDFTSVSESQVPLYKQECANILRPKAVEFEKTLQDFSASGTAVFSDSIVKNGLDSLIILYDLESGKEQTLPAEPGSGLWADEPAVSPDGKWLFYVAGKDNDRISEGNFILSNSKGESIRTIPVSIVSRNYAYKFAHEWLGNNSLRLFSQRDYRDNELVVLLLDPLAEQVTELPTDFDGLQSPLVKNYGTNPNGSPNLKYLDWGVDPFFDVVMSLLEGANVAYSPDKALVFYPHKGEYAVLYDVQNQKELAHVVIRNWGEMPKWSPQGNHISIIATPPNVPSDAAKKDFYLISSDGKQIRRLTYLSEKFERLSIKEYTWSPDGTKIAFWLNTNFPSSADEIVTYELAIVDVTNGNVVNYCLAYLSDDVEELASRAGILVTPVWSPESNQLLVPSIAPAKVPTAFHSNDVRTYLFYPTKLSAIEIRDSIRINGWMTNAQ